MSLYKFPLSILLFIYLLTAATSGYARDEWEHSKQIEIYTRHVYENLTIFQNFLDDLNDNKKRQEIVDLLVKVRCRELENHHKYQVVTAQDSRFFAYQVIAKEIYESLNKKKINNFEFLRYSDKGLMKSPKDFLNQNPFLKKNKIKSEKARFDSSPEISRQLISVSFSMETSSLADSALSVFMFGKGIAAGAEAKKEYIYHENFIQLIRELFENAGIAKNAYEPYLKQLLDSAPRTKQGIINQIFFPKELVDNYLYMSLPLGFLNIDQNSRIHEVFGNFQKSRLSPNFNSKINLQARVLAGALFDDKVTIHRYTLIPEKEQEMYKKLVKTTISRILKNASF